MLNPDFFAISDPPSTRKYHSSSCPQKSELYNPINSSRWDRRRLLAAFAHGQEASGNALSVGAFAGPESDAKT
jgi:hypothetical protein